MPILLPRLLKLFVDKVGTMHKLAFVVNDFLCGKLLRQFVVQFEVIHTSEEMDRLVGRQPSVF